MAGRGLSIPSGRGFDSLRDLPNNMSKQQINDGYDDLMAAIHAAIHKYGSQRALAEHLGVSSAYVSNVMTGQKPLSAELAHHFGFTRRKVYLYERKRST